MRQVVRIRYTIGMPNVWVIGGANGAGKSTFARYVLPTELPFLNADEIAKALPDDFAGNRELESGRQLLRRMDGYTASGASFAVETTLASRSLVPRLRDLQAMGYTVILHYIWVPSPLVSVERVASRVRSGGHDIPESTIHRRYFAGLHNFFHTYAPIADRWRVYENPDFDAPRLVVSRRTDGQVRVVNPKLWKHIQQQEQQHEPADR